MTPELHGSAPPTLQQALRWIGSRVDDIYGASIGKLEDIWMDPDSGEPLWLLVRDGRIGGRHTLVPFAQAASGAGHVWIPFEREVVRDAPAVRPSAPLSHELSDTLRRYYAESGHPVGGGSRAEDAPRLSPQAAPAATVEPERFADPHVSPATASTGQTRAPAPPPMPEAPRRQAWTAASAERAGVAEPSPLPPLPPLPAPPRVPAAEERRSAPPAHEPWTVQRQYEPPPPAREPMRPDEITGQSAAPPPPPAREPMRPDEISGQSAAPPPHQAAPQQPPTIEELRLSVGDGVDMELVGRLQFRGNVVRMQPLPPDAETHT